MNADFFLSCFNAVQQYGNSIELAAFGNAVLEHIFTTIKPQDRRLIESISLEKPSADPEKNMHRVARVVIKRDGASYFYLILGFANARNLLLWDIVARTRQILWGPMKLQSEDIECCEGMANTHQYELFRKNADGSSGERWISWVPVFTDAEALEYARRRHEETGEHVVVKKVLGEFSKTVRTPGRVHLS